MKGLAQALQQRAGNRVGDEMGVRGREGSGPRPPLDRSVDGRKENVQRLLGEFIEDPCEVTRERLLEAFHVWQRCIDRRLLAFEPKLNALERYCAGKIEERARFEGRA